MGVIIQAKLGSFYNVGIVKATHDDAALSICEAVSWVRGDNFPYEDLTDNQKSKLYNAFMNITRQRKWMGARDFIYPFVDNISSAFISCVWTIDLNQPEPHFLVSKPSSMVCKLPLKAIFGRAAPIREMDLDFEQADEVPRPSRPCIKPLEDDSVSHIKVDATWKVQEEALTSETMSLTYPLIFGLLQDFSLAWRHVFEHLEQHNDVVFHRMAWAISNLTSFRFKIKCDTGIAKWKTMKEPFVAADNLPVWFSPLEPFLPPKFRMPGHQKISPSVMLIDGIRWVIVRNLEDGIRKIHVCERDYGGRKPDEERVPLWAREAANRDDEDISSDTLYIVCSIRHLALCRVGEDRHQHWTEPEEFMQVPSGHPADSDSEENNYRTESVTEKDREKSRALNSTRPIGSTRAIALLLSALHPTVPEPTKLNTLPTHIQQLILEYATSSSLQAARLGWDLNLGYPYLWTDGYGVVRPAPRKKKRRSPIEPPDSKVCLDGEIMSGLSYSSYRSNEEWEMSTRGVWEGLKHTWQGI